jgi:acetyl-CoA synthetase
MGVSGREAGSTVWHPDEAQLARAHLTAFMARHDLANFEDLLHKSTHDVAWFTESILEYLSIQFETPYTHVLDLERGPALPRWCVGGRMNIVQSCLDSQIAQGRGENRALVWESEAGESRSLTYLELQKQVNLAASAFLSLGLRKGEIIGLFMPMIPEIAIAMLAIARIGAIVLPLFSGYGSEALATRLEDAGAAALIIVDGHTRRGLPIQMKGVADKAASRLPTLRRMIVVRSSGRDVPMTAGRDLWWHELMDGVTAMEATADTSAEDVLMLIYTSGTTGRPKGAVHTHCGFPVKAAQDMAFGTDVHPGDLIYWMTDMGWMMGPWLLFGTLLLGATCLFYDGAPDYPDPNRVWQICERHAVNVLGLSPTYARAQMALGLDPGRAHDLTSLRSFASTGETWNLDPWLWLFDEVGGGKRPIINYSGGTEVSGGILMGNPILPLKPCAFSAPCPGIAADVFDDSGQPVRGEVGELVIKAPWIGMTRGFWQDEQRYLDTYWSRWPEVWVHGDFARLDPDGSWFILGRSDDTLKIAGKRLGPAEVESIAVGHGRIAEAAAIGLPDEIKGSALVLFCVTAPGVEGEAALADELKRLVSDSLGKPLAPRAVYFLSDLPRTRNAKVMRRMLRAAYLGEALGDTSALVNPEILDEIGALRMKE